MTGQAITQICPQCQMPLVLPAAYAGKSVSCSRCGNTVQVAATPAGAELPPTVAAPAPVLPPHLAAQLGQSAGPMAPFSAAMAAGPRPPHLADVAATQLPPGEPAAAAPLLQSEGPRSSRPRKRKSRSFLGYYLVAAAVLVLAALGMAIYSGKLPLPQLATNSAEEDPGGSAGTGTAGTKRSRKDYTDASRKSVAYSGVAVRLSRVEVGRVRYRSRGKILATETGDYLMITFNVKNKGRAEPVEYQSWYSYKFEDDEEGPQLVELVDENDVALELFPIPEVERVESHGPSDTTLPPGDDMNDTLVFKLPPGYREKPAVSLYLRLPAAAVGDTGYFRFHIPASMVERRDD
jgi:hypothetical protein